MSIRAGFPHTEHAVWNLQKSFLPRSFPPFHIKAAMVTTNELSTIPELTASQSAFSSRWFLRAGRKNTYFTLETLSSCQLSIKRQILRTGFSKDFARAGGVRTLWKPPLSTEGGVPHKRGQQLLRWPFKSGWPPLLLKSGLEGGWAAGLIQPCRFVQSVRWQDHRFHSAWKQRRHRVFNNF